MVQLWRFMTPCSTSNQMVTICVGASLNGSFLSGSWNQRKTAGAAPLADYDSPAFGGTREQQILRLKLGNSADSVTS